MTHRVQILSVASLLRETHVRTSCNIIVCKCGYKTYYSLFYSLLSFPYRSPFILYLETIYCTICFLDSMIIASKNVNKAYL